MRRFKQLLFVFFLIGLTIVFAMVVRSPTIREISVVGWIAADVDVSVGYARTAENGLFAWDKRLYPYRANYYGWEGLGPVFPVKTFPEYLNVSWRLPAPGETPYERCERRLEKDCNLLPGVAQGFRGLETGQLVGPYKVPVNLSPKAKAYIERRGSYHQLSIGVTYGLAPPKLRWILYGDPEHGKVDVPSHNELARGGDW